MKKLILITIAVLLFCAVFAQSNPDWLWARNAGGGYYNEVSSIGNDSSGNIYISGYYYETITFGSITLTSNDFTTDLFVAKLDSEGNWLWARNAGGNSFNYYSSIAIDPDGNCYVTGDYYDSASFGIHTLSGAGDYDCFIAKLDSDGNWLWAKSAGGINRDHGLNIVIDNAGACYVTGWFSDIAGFNSMTLTSLGGWDIFVTKLDTNGNFLWVNKAGGGQNDGGLGIGIDAQSNVYVSGVFTSTASFGTTNLVSSGGDDIFAAKLDADGNWLWAKKAGSYGNDLSSALVTDASGNSYIAGGFVSNAGFGSINVSSLGNSDAFIAKIDTNGNWQWVRSGGGTGNDYAYGLSLNPSGRSVSFSGAFYSSALLGGVTLISSGEHDIFTAKLDTQGNWLWANRSGGANSDYSTDIATDNAGNNFVAGCFDLNAGFGAITLNSIGYTDIFVAKLAEPVPQTPVTLTISKSGNNHRLDWSGVIGALSYKVFGASEPYPSENWILLSHITSNTYIYTGSEPMHFFRIVADTEP